LVDSLVRLVSIISYFSLLSLVSYLSLLVTQSVSYLKALEDAVHHLHPPRNLT